MNSTPLNLEQRVQLVLSSLVKHYLQLDQLTDTMLAKQAKSEPFDSELQLLEQAKAKLQAIEQESLPDRYEYRTSTEHASPDIRKLSEQATGLLEKVIGKINQMEATTRQAHQKLVPTINQSLRAHQMNQAYGKA